MRIALVAMTASAAPIAFALETLLRGLLFPPDFDQVRELLHDYLVIPVWLVTLLVCLTVFAGFVFQKKQLTKKLKHLGGSTVSQRNEGAFGVFMLAASIPQVPAVIATLMFMFGAPLLPVLLTMGISSLGVLLLAWTLGTDERLRS